MKFEELQSKNKAELEKILQDSQEKMRKLRFDLASGKIKNVKELQAIKKTVAKILTLIKRNE